MAEKLIVEGEKVGDDTVNEDAGPKVLVEPEDVPKDLRPPQDNMPAGEHAPLNPSGESAEEEVVLPYGLSSSVQTEIRRELASESDDSGKGHSATLDAYLAEADRVDQEKADAANKETESGSETSSGGSTTPSENGEEGYEDWTVEELQAELENRGLVKSGNKAELVSRLEEDDANQ